MCPTGSMVRSCHSFLVPFLTYQCLFNFFSLSQVTQTISIITSSYDTLVTGCTTLISGCTRRQTTTSLVSRSLAASFLTIDFLARLTQPIRLQYNFYLSKFHFKVIITQIFHSYNVYLLINCLNSNRETRSVLFV